MAASKDKKTATAPKSESGSSNKKAFDHIASAVRAVAARATFLSENDALDVEDHLKAATGDKDAEKRIAERNPEA